MNIKKINQVIGKYGVRLRIKKEGVVRFLALGHKDHALEDYASAMIKNEDLVDAFKRLKINAKTSYQLKKLVQVYCAIENMLEE